MLVSESLPFIDAVVSLELVVFSAGVRITTIIETVVSLKLVVFSHVSAGVRITTYLEVPCALWYIVKSYIVKSKAVLRK